MRSYNSGRTAEAFLAFLHEKVAADKGFARIGSLDALARDFLAAADKTGASAALKTAAEKLDEAQKAAGMLYSKFAEKAASKVRRGCAYLYSYDHHASVLIRTQSVAHSFQNVGSIH